MTWMTDPFTGPRSVTSRAEGGVARRHLLLAAGGILVGGAGLPVPKGDALAFRMIRRGSDIGRHTLTFTRSGDALSVTIVAEALVTLLSVPIVRYRHETVETWRGDTLVGIDGETVKNGAREWVKATRTGGALAVSGSKTHPYNAPETAIGTSYWQKRMLDGPMISLEDGVLLHPNVSVPDRQTIPLASGAEVATNHYKLTGPFSVDVWYDDAATWASMAFSGPDGSEVRYERL